MKRQSVIQLKEVPMAHIEQMMGGIKDAEEQAKKKSIMSGPLPKLGFAYLPAQNIETGYALLQVWNKTDALEGVEVKGYTQPGSNEHHGPLYPVTVRSLNLNEAYPIHQKDFTTKDGTFDKAKWAKENSELDTKLMKMYSDLTELGVRASMYDHRYQRPTGNQNPPYPKEHSEPLPREYTQEHMLDTQHCLVLPCSYPTPPSSPSPNSEGKYWKDNPHWQALNKNMPTQEFKRDTEGTSRFLAYFMAKKLITPKEIEDAYGHAFAVEACKKENVALLKEKLGIKWQLSHEQKALQREAENEQRRR